MQTTLSPKLQPIINTFLTLSPQEQFDLITLLLQFLLGLQRTETITPSMLRPPQKIEAAETDESNSLESLLAQITPDNLHSEIDTGLTVGQEAW